MAMISTAAFYEIDPNGDLFVEVIELDQTAFSSNDRRPILNRGLMRVSRKVLIDHSETFERMLNGRFSESTSNTLTIEDHSIAAVELWFRVLHDTLTDDMYYVERKEIWAAIHFSQLYFIHVEKMNDWFREYWLQLDKPNLEIDEMRELMFPAQKFYHGCAFAYFTKRLANEAAGHITELNPTRHRHLHFRGRVIQQLNSARSSMRGQITSALLDPLGDDVGENEVFCPIKCPGHRDALFCYLQGLKRARIWPLSKMHLRSNREILDSPGFTNWTCEVPENACSNCKDKLAGAVVYETRAKMMKFWEGLCVDCMDISDKAYWIHEKQKIWGDNCTIFSHSTCHYSLWAEQRS